MNRKLISKILLGSLLAMSWGACQEDTAYDDAASLLCITQARENWTGKECNVTYVLGKENTENLVQDLNIGLYMNRTASQNATVDIVADFDTLATLKQMADQGGIYEKYKYALPMPSDCYQLSSSQLTLNAGEQTSQPIQVTIFPEKLIASPLAGEDEKNFFLLPLKIQNATAYEINSKVSSLMLMVYLPQIDKTLPDPREPQSELDGMKLVWNDEFNGTGAPDPDKWNPEQGFKRNNELQWYQGDNAECKNGTLVITGKVERVKNPNYNPNSTDWRKNREYAEYTSTSLVMKNFVFRQGRVIVRAKIPTAMGSWPAIWSTGREVSEVDGSSNSSCWEWPLGGEIDMLEYYVRSGKQSILANACWGSNKRWEATWDSFAKPLDDFLANNRNWKEQFHIWRMDWDNESIRLYLDDELLNEIPLSNTVNGSGGLNDFYKGSWRNPFRDEGNEGYKMGQQMFLNLAIGANGGTPDETAFPLEYLVDYVRIYQ